MYPLEKLEGKVISKVKGSNDKLIIGILYYETKSTEDDVTLKIILKTQRDEFNYGDFVEINLVQDEDIYEHALEYSGLMISKRKVTEKKGEEKIRFYEKYNKTILSSYFETPDEEDEAKESGDLIKVIIISKNEYFTKGDMASIEVKKKGRQSSITEFTDIPQIINE